MRNEKTNVVEQARDKWHGILPAIGIAESFLKDDHGPCPLCGGKDRFRWDNKEGMGTYICGQCGPGNGFDLIKKTLGCEFPEAAARVNEILNGPEISPAIKCNGKGVDEKLAAARDEVNLILSKVQPITKGSPVGSYLKNRGLSGVPPTLHYHPALYHPFEKKSFDGMVAEIKNPAGEIIGVHRTYLKDGAKAKIEKQRLAKKAVENMAGAAIQLYKPKDGRLGVAEGIETALTCHELYGCAVWSVLNTAMMVNFQPPEGVDTVLIFGDNDKNFSGQKAAYALANRLINEGYKVKIYFPPVPGDDFLDELNRTQRERKEKL